MITTCEQHYGKAVDPNGVLPAYRVGPKAVRINKSDLQAVIDPLRAGQHDMSREVRLKVRSDVGKVVAMLDSIDDSWANVDANALIADVFRYREEGTQ